MKGIAHGSRECLVSPLEIRAVLCLLNQTLAGAVTRPAVGSLVKHTGDVNVSLNWCRLHRRKSSDRSQLGVNRALLDVGSQHIFLPTEAQEGMMKLRLRQSARAFAAAVGSVGASAC
jgi:hypothetical protein